jgi:hypothetical protein
MEKLLEKINKDLADTEDRLSKLEKGSSDYDFNYGVFIALLIVLSDIKELIPSVSENQG